MNSTLSIERPEVLTELGQDTLRRLLRVWFDFERQLSRVPIVRRLETNSLTLEDYRLLLVNMRQQVIEGSRWITRCASSFDRDYSDVRSVLIGHANDEHRDYELLEQDYVGAGGKIEEIRNQSKNVGSEALHGYLMYQGSLANPGNMLGAMWIIEGLGNKMANEWAERIEALTGSDTHTRFLRYHGDNDDKHMDKLYGLLDRLCRDEASADNTVMTATVVARLYALQLETIEGI
jgi:3-oxoacyl-[acyl-carrier-protein] synthase-3